MDPMVEHDLHPTEGSVTLVPVGRNGPTAARSADPDGRCPAGCCHLTDTEYGHVEAVARAAPDTGRDWPKGGVFASR